MPSDRDIGAARGALRVFRCLYEREYRTVEIAEAVGLSQPTVQVHLTTLREEGVPLIARRRGRTVSWRVDRIALYDLWADREDRDRRRDPHRPEETDDGSAIE